MSSCDASILDEIPNDIAKLAVHIVKRWWTSALSQRWEYISCAAVFGSC
jgi:hypothetical protein